MIFTGKVIRTGTVHKLWVDVINDAEAKTHWKISDESKQQLISTLIEHTHMDGIGGQIDSVIAPRMCVASQETGECRNELYRQIGNQCLLSTGLFPKRYHRRHVSPTYYLLSGKSAYDTLASKKAFHGTFESPAREFLGLARILHAAPPTIIADEKYLAAFLKVELRDPHTPKAARTGSSRQH